MKSIMPPISDISIYSINKEHSMAPPCYQILMVLQGNVQIQNETYGHEYSLRDMVILSPGKNYHVIPAPDNLALVLGLERNFVQEQLGNNIQIVCDSREEPQKDYAQLRNIISSIVSSYYENAEGNKLMIYAMLFQLMALLQKYFIVSTINLSGAPQNARHLSRIQEIINYIEENYQSAITLSSLAESLFLSPQYLSKFIKQHFHKTFYDYLNQVRIEHALAEIQYTDMSITKIAFNNGFPNLTAFNKIFKDFYHTTPSSYRREFLKSVSENTTFTPDPLDDENISVEDFENARAYISELSESEDSQVPQESPLDMSQYVVHANTLEFEPLQNPFTAIINVGFAINMLSSDFQEQLVNALNTVDFKYIRFIGILDDEILPQVNEPAAYNFSNVDMILDFLHEHQRIPFIELSIKPKKTTIVTTNTGFLVNPLLEQAFPSHFYTKLEFFLRHCINRYGQAYVASWYFEAWAAHTDYLEYVETPAEYAIRFQKIQHILAKHIPRPKLGGPGFNTSAPITTLSGFLQELSQKKLQPEFISLYLYPYKFTTETYPRVREVAEYVLLSSDKDILSKKLNFFAENIQKYYRQMPPIFVTEYNSDLAGKNHLNDSCFQAAFICKNFISLKDRVGMMSYWLLCDMSEDYSEFASTKSGGIGLLNERGQKKPAFFAYEFLNELGRRCICEGENYMVTQAGPHAWRILAFNYAHVNKYYCLNHTDRVSVEDTYSIFENVAPLNMEFKLYELTPGQYKIKRHLLNREHGSILDQMARMWFQGNLSFERLSYNMRNLSRQELDYFTKTCIPEQSIFYKESDGTMTLNCKIAAHEVVFFEISLEL